MVLKVENLELKSRSELQRAQAYCFFREFLNYSDWTVPFIVNTDDLRKIWVLLSVNIIIKLFLILSRRLSNPYWCYTTTRKKIVLIVELLQQFWDILIGEEISYYQIIRILYIYPVLVKLKYWCDGNLFSNSLGLTFIT